MAEDKSARMKQSMAKITPPPAASGPRIGNVAAGLRPAAQPAALPDYSQDAFADNLPKWSALMQSGAKTADQIIAIVSTKGVLSDAQKSAIRAAAQPKQETHPEVIDAPEQKAQADDDGWIEDYESTEAGQ